jgi:hypothetical protein
MQTSVSMLNKQECIAGMGKSSSSCIEEAVNPRSKKVGFREILQRASGSDAFHLCYSEETCLASGGLLRHNAEGFGFKERREFLEPLSDYQILKKDSAP